MVAHSNDNQADGLDEALTRFVNAYLQGEKPDIDEFVKQYPQHETNIRRRVDGLCEIDALFDSLVQTDESDFDDAVAGDELVGQRIGDFEIVAIVGRGGMGVVYRARDTRLDRTVAIKSIPPGLASRPNARIRFKCEAKLLASLNHPNIAVIHDIIEQDECAGYLILEYVPGETLTERIAREPLKLEETLSIGRQVAEAVSAAHKKGIVHRDLKPGNIKITPDGRVKVLDFGLAKSSMDEGKLTQTTVTQPCRIIGTPAYMSPEQARGKDTDHRTDIWSFGCIMYQMLTGRFPFEGETATDTLAGIIEREPDWKILPQDTPTNVRILLRRCLEKNVDSRLGNITDATHEIREILSAPALAVPAKSRKVSMFIGLALIIVLTALAVRLIPRRQDQPSSDQTRLMVLPFENMGHDENEYFATGITNEIIARLVDIHSLGIISAMQYKNREQSAMLMTKELRVNYVLQGTVHKKQSTDPNSSIRITPQLIKASDDTLVWTKAYEVGDIVRIQSDIAKQVTHSLGITLLDQEQEVLAYVPTRNMKAYDYYLQGEEYFRRSYSENDLEMAINMYDNAVKLDKNYTIAYCRLSMAHTWLYWFYPDFRKEHIHLAWEAVRKAQELDLDLPEVHQALGRYYYLGLGDYTSALSELFTALESQPDNSDVLSFIGFIQRRQGKPAEALENLMKASELNPLYDILVQEVADTLASLRSYEKAEQYYNRAIMLAPNKSRAYGKKALLYVSWKGRTDKAREVLNEALQKIGTTENPFFGVLARLDMYDRDYKGALHWLSLTSEDLEAMALFTPRPLRFAKIYRYMGEKAKAKEYFEQAKDILELKMEEDPNDARFRSSLGISYAGLGRNEDAIREGKLAVELMPVTKDVSIGRLRISDLARIYVMVGKYDDAMDQLDFLHFLKPLSIPMLRLDPTWDPLRDHPRFKELIESGIQDH